MHPEIIQAMTQTLDALKSGKLTGSKTLKLAAGLTEFPEEILTLADTLEVLDLSDNQLTGLPDSIARLRHLKILFFARNHFTEFPAVLAKLPILSMIGFKSNQIKTVPENAFPPLLRWLILTDNKLSNYRRVLVIVICYKNVDWPVTELQHYPLKWRAA